MPFNQTQMFILGELSDLFKDLFLLEIQDNKMKCYFRFFVTWKRGFRF
jgi:hypothetical protein